MSHAPFFRMSRTDVFCWTKGRLIYGSFKMWAWRFFYPSLGYFTIFALAFHGSSGFAAYKCVTSTGKVAYQEQACEAGHQSVVSGNKQEGPVTLQQHDPLTAPQLSENQLREKVLESLKDPVSANFKGTRIRYEGRALCGEVNAKNSYGGYIGFRQFVADAEGVYWAGDGSSLVDVGRIDARRTFVPKSHFWGCR